MMRQESVTYVDSKAECNQLNLTRVARNKRVQKETKTNKRQCPLSSVQVKIREGSPEGIRRLWRKGFVKELDMGFTSGVKGRKSDSRYRPTIR